MKTLWFVVPCYNEEDMLPICYKALKDKLDKLIKIGKISLKSKIAFIDDGSNDKTWQIIEDIHFNDSSVVGINLSKNKGHQNALLAGLMTAKDYADFTISLDADLQDDIDAIDAMIDDYLSGKNIVFGVRASRKTDSCFKRLTAEGFYKFMKKMGVDTVFNHADFRLMDKTSLFALSDYGETNLFLRGIVTDIGLSTSVVSYERKKREKGVSKYPLKKMVGLAEDGITSFSVKPLRVAYGFSVFSAFLTLIFVTLGVIDLVFWEKLFSLFFVLSAIFLTGTLVLFCLQIMGIYIGKIYMETKNRPRYIISKKLIKD